MTSHQKIAANRRNARRSTGPRSAAGKLRARRNALKFGLSIAIANDPKHAAQLESLAKLLAGGVSQPGRLVLAQRAAEAELELMRVRNLRTMSLQLAKIAPEGVAMDETEPPIGALGNMMKLERYERRAFSRRKRLFRELARLSLSHVD